MPFDDDLHNEIKFYGDDDDDILNNKVIIESVFSS